MQCIKNLLNIHALVPTLKIGNYISMNKNHTKTFNLEPLYCGDTTRSKYTAATVK